MNMDPWLLPQIGIGNKLKPISPNMFLVHTNWQEQLLKAMYSASVDDRATVFC